MRHACKETGRDPTLLYFVRHYPTWAGLCSLNSTASVSVPSIMRLTLGTLTTTLTNPTETAFDAGFQDDAGPTATVKSNRPWNLTIGALTASWVGSNGGRATKGA